MMLRAFERMDGRLWLPESRNSRHHLGQDLQPVGDYAGIDPYYRISDDVGEVQSQDKIDPEAFQPGNWWWGLLGSGPN